MYLREKNVKNDHIFLTIVCRSIKKPLINFGFNLCFVCFYGKNIINQLFMMGPGSDRQNTNNITTGN